MDEAIFSVEKKTMVPFASLENWKTGFFMLVGGFNPIWPNGVRIHQPRFPGEIKGPISLLKSATKTWGLLTDFGFVFGRDSNWSQPSDGFTSLESFGFASCKRQASQDRRWRVKIAPCRETFFFIGKPTVGGERCDETAIKDQGRMILNMTNFS